MSRLAQSKICTDKAIANAIMSVGTDLLTGLYLAKTHNVAAVRFASN